MLIFITTCGPFRFGFVRSERSTGSTEEIYFASDTILYHKRCDSNKSTMATATMATAIFVPNGGYSWQMHESFVTAASVRSTFGVWCAQAHTHVLRAGAFSWRTHEERPSTIQNIHFYRISNAVEAIFVAFYRCASSMVTDVDGIQAIGYGRKSKSR